MIGNLNAREVGAKFRRALGRIAFASLFLLPLLVSGAETLLAADEAAAPRQHGKSLTGQTLLPGRDVRVLPERHVAKDTPGLFGGWVIHKSDFRAPKLMALARLQAWTLKPATASPHFSHSN